MPGLSFDIAIEDARWRKIPGLENRLQKAARSIALHLPKIFRRHLSTVAVLLTNDATIRRLNRDFRGLDRPTNVLSFPQFSPCELSKIGKKRGETHIGDIALGYQYIVAETKKNHNILINHASHLVIHGALHLFGYDHEREQTAIRMERLETSIMAGLGLPDPYAAGVAKTKTPKRQKPRERARLAKRKT